MSPRKDGHSTGTFWRVLSSVVDRIWTGKTADLVLLQQNPNTCVCGEHVIICFTESQLSLCETEGQWEGDKGERSQFPRRAVTFLLRLEPLSSFSSTVEQEEEEEEGRGGPGELSHSHTPSFSHRTISPHTHTQTHTAAAAGFATRSTHS